MRKFLKYLLEELSRKQFWPNGLWRSDATRGHRPRVDLRLNRRGVLRPCSAKNRVAAWSRRRRWRFGRSCNNNTTVNWNKDFWRSMQQQLTNNKDWWSGAVWPDVAIYCTLDNFSKPLETLCWSHWSGVQIMALDGIFCSKNGGFKNRNIKCKKRPDMAHFKAYTAIAKCLESISSQMHHNLRLSIQNN